jgi:hypothetical protein
MSVEYPACLPVSFIKVPPARISEKVRQLEDHGWYWIRNLDQRWVALMRKEFDTPVSEQAAEEELRVVMGEYYVNLAAPGSPRNLPGGSQEDLPPTALEREQRLIRHLLRFGWR